MVFFDPKSYGKSVTQLISWGHWFAFFNVIAAILLSFAYIYPETKPDTALGAVYMLCNWLSHVAFITFLFFILTVFPLTLIYPKTRFIRGSASFLFTCALTVLLLDALTYNQLGYHLSTNSLPKTIDLLTSYSNSQPVWFFSSALLIFVGILVFELVSSNYAWKHLRQLQRTWFAKITTGIIIALFFISHSMHIWADATLNYDILRQDTSLPFSYPTTAKTLLTKYGLIDRGDYIKRKNSPLSFSTPVPNYPDITEQCSVKNENSIVLVIKDSSLTQEQVNRFSDHPTFTPMVLNNHIDNAQRDNAWFNLFYSLPTIYQTQILAQNKAPALIQLLEANELNKSLTTVAPKDHDASLPKWLTALFPNQSVHNDISGLIDESQLALNKSGLYLYYFNGSSDYQYELFVEALFLAQANKEAKDIIWLSSIGNLNTSTAFISKPALLFVDKQRGAENSMLTSQMDVQPSLINHYFDCQLKTIYASGEDFYQLRDDRVLANTMDQGIMIFNKDITVFVDQNGNFQSYSTALKTPINESSNFPLLIDGVNFIKSFSKQAQLNDK